MNTTTSPKAKKTSRKSSISVPQADTKRPSKGDVSTSKKVKHVQSSSATESRLKKTKPLASVSAVHSDQSTAGTSKQAQIVAMLRQSKGATLVDLRGGAA